MFVVLESWNSDETISLNIKKDTKELICIIHGHRISAVGLKGTGAGEGKMGAGSRRSMQPLETDGWVLGMS